MTKIVVPIPRKVEALGLNDSGLFTTDYSDGTDSNKTVARHS